MTLFSEVSTIEGDFRTKFPLMVRLRESPPSVVEGAAEA